MHMSHAQDEVAKLQKENEALRKQLEELSAKFSEHRQLCDSVFFQMDDSFRVFRKTFDELDRCFFRAKKMLE